MKKSISLDEREESEFITNKMNEFYQYSKEAKFTNRDDLVAEDGVSKGLG